MKIKKYLLILFIFVVFFPIKSLAYTSTDTIDIIFDDQWYNNLGDTNLTLSGDSSVLTGQTVNDHLSYITNQINQDMATYGWSYYFVDVLNLGAYNTSINYNIHYTNDLTWLTSNNFDVYNEGNVWGYPLHIVGSEGQTAERQITFNGENSNYMTIGSYTGASSRYLDYIIMSKNIVDPTTKEMYLPTTLFLKTNIPQEYISQMHWTIYNGSTVPNLKINGTPVLKGNSYVLGDFVSQPDITPPVITLNGSEPLNLKIGTTYSDLGVAAIDDKDGDISSNVIVTSNVNPLKLGNYTVTYDVCDSSNNCSQAIRHVNVVDGLTEVDITGKYAIIFYFKNRTSLVSNAMKDVDQNGNKIYTPVYQFEIQYMGYFKYGETPMPLTDNMSWDDYTSKITQVSYDNYKSMYFINYMDALDYGLIFYNANLEKNAKFRYDADVFGYKIFNEKYNSESQDIDYVDKDGNQHNDTVTNPPQTTINYDDTSYSNLFDNISGFLDQQNNNLQKIRTVINDFWSALPLTVSSFLTVMYAGAWVGFLIHAIRK